MPCFHRGESGGSNEMHQGGNYQDFLKWKGGGVFLGHSLIIIK